MAASLNALPGAGGTVQTVQTDQIAVGWDDRILAAHTLPHFMQSSTWARIRSGGPWDASRRNLRIDRNYPVLAFERHAEGLGILQHLPRVSGLEPADIRPLTERVREDRGHAFATKIEVYQPRDTTLDAAFAAAGWRPTRASQYRYGISVDLDGGEEEILARMKKRARAEIRIGDRNGITVERAELGGADEEEMIALVRATERRSGAFFRSDEYLRTVWRTYDADDGGRLYLARHEGRVVCGAFVVCFGRRAWYKDGGSNRDLPNLMASRLMQWRIIQELAAEGYVDYDLGHVPDPDSAHPAGRGILIFKGAFAATCVEYQPAYLLVHEEAGEAWRLGESAFIAEHRASTGDDFY